MRRFRNAILALALAAGLGTSAPEAARDVRAAPPASGLELLVLEVRGCGLCDLVRRKLQPVYERSAHAREMPLRYIDMTAIDETALGLKEPVMTVPTIVLMRDGIEVDRIVGYTGPETFFAALGQMLAGID